MNVRERTARANAGGLEEGLWIRDFTRASSKEREGGKA
jgi:hypothetical protein